MSIVVGTAGRSARVLVIDDVEAHRRLLDILLTDEGYTVEAVGTGREALESAAERPPDVIILDLALPDMHGLELLERLRSGDGEIPVLVVSGDVSPSARIASLRATEFVMKPYDVDAVIEAVARLLGAAG